MFPYSQPDLSEALAKAAQALPVTPEWVVVTGPGGFYLGHYSQQSIDVQQIAGLMAANDALGKSIALGMANGSLQQVLIAAPHGTYLLVSVQARLLIAMNFRQSLLPGSLFAALPEALAPVIDLLE